MPSAVERRLVEQKDALEVRILGQELDGERLVGLGVDQLLIAHLVTGLAEQPHRFAQIVAHLFRRAVDRIGIRLLEDLGRHLVAHGFKQFEFAPARQAGRGKLGAFEIAGDAFVLAVENLLVHLLEIESVVEGQPHPRILEFVAADVESEGLHHAGTADRKFLEQDALVADGREVVSGGPILGAVLGAPIDRIGLEGFKRHRRVAEIFEVQLVEIIAADIDVQRLAPMVLDAFVDDVAARPKIP